MQNTARLTLRIEATDADEEELSDLTRQLLSEVRRDTDVDSADLVQSTRAPEGTKAAGVVEIGALVIQTLPAAIPGLLGVLRSWTSRRADAKIKITVKVENRSVDVEYPVGTMTHDQLMNLIAVVSERPEAGH
jgi:hypothetical protein